MDLIKKLERRAAELDQVVRWRGYDQQAADDRELLLTAVECFERVAASGLENYDNR